MAVIKNGLLTARVMHMRHAPREHKLVHDVFYLAMPVEQLTELKNFKSLSYNRLNFFQLRDRDYGFDKIQTLSEWPRAALAQFTDFVPSEILLITMPRTFGFGFNPVSFWCYFDEAQNLRAVMAEVNNTFNQRHAYLCRHVDGVPITPGEWLTAEKVFHVSPFFDVLGRYTFRFDIRPDKIGIWIDYFDHDQKLLSTAVTGTRTDLTSSTLWQAFWKNPFVTLKTIGLIHVHALFLIVKSIRYRHPAPMPKENITQ